MKRLTLIVLLLVLIVPAVVSAQEPAYDNVASPVDLLASYYNAIARQEYAWAYNYWGSPPRPYAQFAAGFADTTSVQLIVQPPTRVGVAAGSAYVQIPTVVLAGHTDGTLHTFAGCFTTRKSNLQPPSIPEPDVWHIYSARLREVSNTSAIPALLTNACDEA